ncbi:hypothetical protein H2203_004565 [Taxawa tesnikishii (nom. ined.)]|nr:hypothetical protein H2203_004565 [Dothideales sp. JES 119]
MLFRQILSALALSTSMVLAAPAASAEEMLITNIQTHQPSSRSTTDKNVTISFTVQNPDPLSGAVTTCSGSWPLNSTHGYPTGGYQNCANSSYAWNFADNGFQNIYTFTLQVENVFTDPSVGQPPWDQMTSFAHASISKSNLTCTHHSDNEIACEQPANSTIKAPIWAQTA